MKQEVRIWKRSKDCWCLQIPKMPTMYFVSELSLQKEVTRYTDDPNKYYEQENLKFRHTISFMKDNEDKE